MLFLHKSRPIAIEWEIRPMKGHSMLAQSPVLKVLLWDGARRYLINPTMIEGNTICFSIPKDMNAATYGLYVIWIDRMRPGFFSMNGRSWQDMVMRSMVRDAFCLVETEAQESNVVKTEIESPSGIARLSLTSVAHPLGPDALDAYEISVLRGNGDDESLWIKRLEEALRNISALGEDYVTGDVNGDGTGDARDIVQIESLLTENSNGVLRAGDRLREALTKLDAYATANRRKIASTEAGLKQEINKKQEKLTAGLGIAINADNTVEVNADALVGYGLVIDATGALDIDTDEIARVVDVETVRKGVETESERAAKVEAAMQKQIDGATETTTTKGESYGKQLGFVPADETASRSYLKALGSGNMAGPISLKKGDAITTSVRTDIRIYRVWRDGENNITENCTIEKMGEGTYAATEAMEVLLYDPQGKGLMDSDGSRLVEYTIVSTTKSLQTQIDELQAMVRSMQAKIDTIDTTGGNGFSIINDDDQDPTTP